MMQALLVVLVLLSLSVGTSIAQIAFDPQFNIGDREVEEGGSLVVRLSADALTDSLLLIPGLNTSGCIEVDLILEQGTTEPFAQFGVDYFFCDNASSIITTVCFKVRQTNSTEVKICIFDDNTFENSEFFQLRILAVRFPPNLRPFFILIPGFNSVSVPIELIDNDIVNVRWMVDSVSVKEGVDQTVSLRVVSEGVFARPISIGVACSPVRASDVSAAEENCDWTVSQTALIFSDVEVDRASSDSPLIATIVDNDVAEPRESFFCNLLSGNADPVKAVPPTQVTVSITDDDELVISWEQDFYRSRESDLLANATLMTASNFSTSVRIPGFPIQIVNNITSVTAPGPIIPNFGPLPATINFITFRGIQYRVARVAGRTQFPDIVSSVNDFSFTSTAKRDTQCSDFSYTSTSKRATQGFDIKDDAILEYDELFMAVFDISSLIDAGWNARKGDSLIAYIAIEDDDSVEVNFKESSYRVNESAGQVQVTLMVTGQFFKVISATVECEEGSATDPEDWEEARQYRVQFRLTRTSDRIAPLGEAESEPIILNITNDAICEGDEVFTCRIVSTSDAATVKIGPRNEVPVTIVGDDKFVVDPQFNIGDRKVTEGRTLAVRLSADALTDRLLTSCLDMSGFIEVDLILEQGTTEPFTQFGVDYFFCDNASSTIFTVRFVVGQTNSTEVKICTSDDNTFENSEFFLLRILAVRFPPNLRPFFILIPGFNSVSVPIEIEDNDIVNVRWVVDSVSVKEGVNRTVALWAVSEGVFARPISIGVACSPVRASDVSAAEETLDWTVSQTALIFSEVDRVSSDSPLIATIVDDDVAEPRESFICNLQSGNADPVKAVPPTQVTVSITDDDELVISWEWDFYRSRESDLLANVTLVTTSNFDTSVRIPGFPTQIVNNITSVTVPGPIIPNFGPLPATINFITFRGIQYGVARVAGRTQFPDIVSSVNDFSFTPTSKRSTRGFDIKNDAILEYDELFMAEFDISSLIDAGWNARKGDFPVTYIAIEDDDSVEVNFKESIYRVNESAGQVQVTLIITGQFFKVINATVECVEGNATDPEDWEEARQHRVQFRLTRTSDRIAPLGEVESEPIVLNITNDTIYEGDEVFTCHIVSTSDAATVRIGPRNEVPVTIVDDDGVVVRYEMDRYQVEEEAGYLEVALLLKGTSLHPVSVAVNTLFLLDSSVGAAASVVDFVSINRQIITFEPGETRKAYNITINDDVIPEDSEFFNLDFNLADSSDAHFVTIGTPKQPLVEILDKDVAVNISLSARTYSIFESEARVVVTVTLTGAYSQDITVNVNLAESGNVVPLERAITDVDFLTDGFPREVTIPAGETSQEFVILINDEGIVEKDEKFHVFFTYSGAQPGVLVTPGFDEAVVEIKNDDALHVEFDRELYRMREDALRVKINIIANSTASFDYEVNLALSDITAIFGVDYDDNTDVGSASGMVQPELEPFVKRMNTTIIIGAGSDMAMSEVVIIDDEIYEGVESFHVNLSVLEFFKAQNILEGDPIVARVEIEDEDILSVRFDPANYEVNEGENKVLILLANRTFDVSFDIDVYLFENTATAEDYDDRNYVVTFDVETQMSMLVVHANEDMILEDPEMFLARLSIPSGLERVVEGDPAEAKITIIDRTEVQVFFDPVMYPIDEGEKANLTLKLTKEVASGVTIVVQYVTQDGSAKDGEDYTGGVYNVTFVGSNIATVPVPSIDDDTVEGVEHFTAVICVPSDTQRDHMVTRGSPDTAIVEINDNDMLMVFFDCERYSVSEDDGVARITVRSTKPHTLRCTVIVTAADGSATIDEDYRGNRFEVTFPVGSQSVTFDIPIVNDTVFEGPEFFNLSIVVPQEAADMGVEPGIPIDAFVDITDDEIVNVFFDPNMYNVTEGGVALITVRADREFTVPFSVIVTLQDGSAVAPGDYDSSQSPYIVTFQPGQPTRSISVPAINDNIVEMRESFTAVLSNTDESRNPGVNVIDPDEATVHIFDNASRVNVFFQNTTLTFWEDYGNVSIKLKSNGWYKKGFTVSLLCTEVFPKEATENVDFVGGVHSVQFPDFPLEKDTSSTTAEIAIIDDKLPEHTEAFFCTLIPSGSNIGQIGPGVFIGCPSVITVVIKNDDVLAPVYVGFISPRIYGNPGRNINVIVNRYGTISEDIRIEVLIKPISAVEGVDYRLRTRFVVFTNLDAIYEARQLTIEVLSKRSSVLEVYLKSQPGVTYLIQRVIVTIR